MATPINFLTQMREGNVSIGDVAFLVIDEADTMFDAGFGAELAQIISPLKSRGGLLTSVLVSATVNRGVRQLMAKQFPGIETVETASLHRGISGSHHSFVPVQPGTSRMDALSQVRCACARTHCTRHEPPASPRVAPGLLRVHAPLVSTWRRERRLRCGVGVRRCSPPAAATAPWSSATI